MLQPILKFLPLVALVSTLTSCCVVYPTTIVYIRPSDSSSDGNDEDASQTGIYVASFNAHPAKNHSLPAGNATTRMGQGTNVPPVMLRIDAVPRPPKDNL